MIGTLLFILLMPFASAQANQISGIQQTDSSSVTPRYIDAQTLQELTSDPVFDYKELPANPDSLLKRLQRWLIQFLQSVFQNPWADAAVKFIFFGIFTLVLIGLINHIMGGNISGVFSGNKAGETFRLNISEQDLSETDYDKLLENAQSEQRYSDAVRIIYLKSLQQLSEAGLISWKSDKTNHDYLNELSNHPAKPSFSKLTDFYEFVEYGNFSIQKEGFSAVKNMYLKFTQQLSS